MLFDVVDIYIRVWLCIIRWFGWVQMGTGLSDEYWCDFLVTLWKGGDIWVRLFDSGQVALTMSLVANTLNFVYKGGRTCCLEFWSDGNWMPLRCQWC
jgi:hypothetical protein